MTRERKNEVARHPISGLITAKSLRSGAVQKGKHAELFYEFGAYRLKFWQTCLFPNMGRSRYAVVVVDLGNNYHEAQHIFKETSRIPSYAREKMWSDIRGDFDKRKARFLEEELDGVSPDNYKSKLGVEQEVNSNG